MTLPPDLPGRRILLLLITVFGWHVMQAQSYCRPSLGSCCEWISNVSIGTLNHNSINEPGYADYTAMSATISKGTTIPISVKVSTNSIYIEHVKVFFDWDRDFVFESSVYLGSAKFTGTKIFTGNVTVPSDALDGCSMMRVFMQYAKEPAGACTSSGDGEVEDYTVVVSNSTSPVANFSVPNSLCSQGTINFTNLSAISDNAPLNYSWDFGDGTSSMAAHPSKTYTEPGTYQVKLTASTFCTTHTISKAIVVNPLPVITEQPANTSACTGGIAVFTVMSPTPGVSYQWQVNKGVGFTDVVANSIYKNTTTSSLHISGVSSEMQAYQYRCVVTKNCPVASAAAALIIPSAPMITDHPEDISVCEGKSATLSVAATGAGLTYQWQIDSGEGFKDLTNDQTYSSTTTGLLTIAAIKEEFEVYRYRCVVTGLCKALSAVAKIKVNDAPLISAQPADLQILEGESATFSVTASGEGLTYQWQKNTGGNFSNILENDRYKNVKTSKLIVDNAILSEHNNLFRCVLSGVCEPAVTSNAVRMAVLNPRPAISSIPVTEVKEDTPYAYELVVSDFTNRALVLTATKKPTWLSFDPHSKRLSGGPTNNDVGDHEVVVRVSNGLFETEQSFTIKVTNVNDSPTITSIAPTKAQEDTRYEYAFRGHDIDKNDVLRFSAISKPEWLNFDEGTGVLAGTPTNQDVGSCSIILQVTDGHATTTQQFFILVENVNDAPLFISVPLLTVDEDSPYGYDIKAYDVDKDDVLNFTVSEKPEWMTFDATAKTVRGTPTNADVGMYFLKIQVSDGLISVEQKFNVTVSNVNDAPVIVSHPNTIVHTGDHYEYALEADDQDNDKLIYKAESVPSWLSFHEQSGKLSGKTSLPGSFSIILKVSDGLSEVSQNFDITVVQNTDPIDTIISPIATHPTEVLLSNKSFETTTTSNEVIGSFTTVDEDHGDHTYQLVNGSGADANSLFNLVDNDLYLKNRLIQASSSKEFSIRIRSTNSSGNFIEEVFVLEKYDPERNASGIEIPTTFSPNADGVNDTWIIKDLKDYTDVSIEVYDRSGVPLFKSTNPTQGWDGSVLGGKTMEGPFFYIVKVQHIVKKGVLIVIR